MNKVFEQIALDAGLLNYIDNETPRVCFISDWAELPEVEDYGKYVLREVFRILREQDKVPEGFNYGKGAETYIRAIKNEFGIL